MMIESIQQKYNDWDCVVYSGDQVKPEDILKRVRDRFDIQLDESRVIFHFIQSRHLLDAKNYPYFTMLGQSIGSIFVAIEALDLQTPNVFVDSMGYSFTLWVARLIGKCKVVAYVHYPTISSDMLSRVNDGTQSYNNRRIFSRIPLLKRGKLFYYHLFAWLYGKAGRACSLVFVNSTWTKNHINSLWNIPNKTMVLYPPCNTSELSNLPLNSRESDKIISIAQFRPEKDHALQIKSFARMLEIKNNRTYKLILIGSCRHKDDEALVKGLRELAKEVRQYIKEYYQFLK